VFGRREPQALTWQDAQAIMETIMRIDFKLDRVLEMLGADDGEQGKTDA
jgi:hypothetical protein